MARKPPFENCTKEEAIAYLEEHINEQNLQIEKLQEALTNREDKEQKKAFAMDRAIRIYEKSLDAPTFDQLQAMSDKILSYTTLDQKEAV